ncbi:alanine/glycine:cation symporter family protein [Cerasicoccus maritimus]|uniref:alanine/glycine:cation symporter family protein n=1 Tax=Cerasicoccus maritimus TaxID=490089 RepID=UPI0028525A42|nr:alanine/glycine:cation symporter family protein [Cerasicoccus maritimus]
MDWLNNIISSINGVLWGYLLVYLLLGVGVYFTVRSRFVQVRLFFQSFREMLGGVKGGENAISPFQAFATGLASRVGTGNIAGVAVAISLGGPGAVFWMWVTALVGMASSVIECSLAQLYKVKHGDSTFRGGPAYYIQYGLGSRKWGIVFAVALIICFGLVFNAVQTNSIRVIVEGAYGVPSWVTAIVVTALAAPVIFGGVRSVAVLAGVMVPIMAVAYLLMAGYAVVHHISELPSVLALIVKSAFGLQEAAGGFTGFAVSQAMTMGIKRGLFSNEAGMGSAPNAAATATANHPVGQALLQMLGAFIDTIIVCTATAVLILVSGAYDPLASTVGPELTHHALENEVGGFGKHFLAVAIFFFGFSSIIGNYAYAEGNVEFIRRSPRVIFIFRVIVLGMVFFGAVGEAPLVWNMADLSQATMALINLVAISLLGGVAMKLLRDYEAQLKSTKKPVFKSERTPELKDKLPSDSWN